LGQGRHINRAGIAAISLAIAVICVIGLTLMVRDRWNRPEVRTADQAREMTTGSAARSAGANVSPTDRNISVEPPPTEPKPVQPAVPD